MANVNPIPEGIHTLTPHITIKGAANAIDWYAKVLGAREEMRMVMPGTDIIMHARLSVGDSHVMLNDEFPQSGSVGPKPDEKASAIHAYVEDVDAVYKQAMDNGATEVLAPMDTFWGDRYGKFTDPFGHHWSVASRIEALTPEQIGQRSQEYFAQMKQG